MAELFKGPKLPTPEKPTPLPDEKQMTAARKKRMSEATTTSGYQSTILSTAGSKEKLGP